MNKNFTLSLFLAILVGSAYSQESVPLFQSKEILSLQATGSIKSIKKNTNDSTLVAGKFQYEKSPGEWITIATQARVRGNFRLKNCYFPPLKLKFNKKEIESTVFAGNKSLKLVLPCHTSANKDVLIRKEYLCYQFYELLSPYHFRTRLANLKLSEVSRQKTREYELLTFFVEDNSMVAKRGNGKIMEMKGLNPGAFDEKQALRTDYFQYMIGNADFSSIYQHNSNVMYANGKYVALSYDFDMSGFVNADYAHDNPPQLGTGNPRERVYRGFCKSQPAMEEIRREFLDKEASIHALIDQESSTFSSYDLKDMHNYLDEFFAILKNDNQFKRTIAEGCRTDK